MSPRRMTAAALVLLALGIYGLAPPFWAPLAQSIRAGKLAVLEIGLLAAAASFLRWWPLRALAWWAIIGFCLSYNASAMSATWRILLGLLAIERLASLKLDLALFLTGWRLLTVVHTSYMLLQLCGIDPIFSFLPGQDVGSPATGFMDNEWAAAGYTAMTLPLFTEGSLNLKLPGFQATVSRRWWLIPSLALILVSGALGAVVVAVLTMSLSVWRTIPKITHRGLLVGGFCALIFGLYGHIEPIWQKLKGERINRVLVWRETLNLTYRSTRTALIGHGPGQFRRIFRRDAKIVDYLRWEVAHNEPLQLLFELGSIGLWLMLFMVLAWLLVGWGESGALRLVGEITAGWTASSLIIFSGHLACLAIVGVMCAGILEGARRLRQS